MKMAIDIKTYRENIKEAFWKGVVVGFFTPIVLVLFAYFMSWLVT